MHEILGFILGYRGCDLWGQHHGSLRSAHLIFVSPKEISLILFTIDDWWLSWRIYVFDLEHLTVDLTGRS